VAIRLEGDLLLRSERSSARGGEQPQAGSTGGEELPGHAQVEYQTAAVVERADQILPATLERGDGAAGERPAQARRTGQEEVAVARGADARDRAPDQHRGDAPARDLDLGELRHGGLQIAPGAGGRWRMAPQSAGGPPAGPQGRQGCLPLPSSVADA